MIDFEEEIERFKPSLDVENVEDAIVCLLYTSRCV